MSKEETTRVIFRAFESDGIVEVIALFPDHKEPNGCCSSYMHVGQHSPASYRGIVRSTRPAMPEQFAALEKELCALGYRLKIVKRVNRKVT